MLRTARRLCGTAWMLCICACDAARSDNAAPPDAAVHDAAPPPPPPPPWPSRPPPDFCALEVCRATEPARDKIVSAERPPPALSGGTLLTSRDGSQLIAADPNRDQLYFVDTASHALAHTRSLEKDDEPGRLVEDGDGRIHVILRRGGAVASLGRKDGDAVTRRKLCPQPRGIAYDARSDALFVACLDGGLFELPADPSGEPQRIAQLDRDLRDVMVRDDTLFVSRMRSAELLVLDRKGTLLRRDTPPSSVRAVRIERQPLAAVSKPNTAWRTIDVPGRGTLMLHQRSAVAATDLPAPERSCNDKAVASAISVGLGGDEVRSLDLYSTELVLDLAADPLAQILATAGPDGIHLLPLTGRSLLNLKGGPAQSADVVCAPGSAISLNNQYADNVSVTFASSQELASQQLEPAGISFYDLTTRTLTHQLDLAQASTFDTGHRLFHNTFAKTACASCHPEGVDDGQTWNLHNAGKRRTPSLRGGILATAPFKWDGTGLDFEHIVQEMHQLSGGSEKLWEIELEPLGAWLGALPAPAAPARDPDAAARGKVLFESAAVSCSGCHKGEQLTDNQTYDVGTGGQFQVPSLRGVSFRPPLLHDGCAPDLRAVLTECHKKGQHGHVSQLASAQLDELVSYLETL